MTGFGQAAGNDLPDRNVTAFSGRNKDSQEPFDWIDPFPLPALTQRVFLLAGDGLAGVSPMDRTHPPLALTKWSKPHLASSRATN